MTNDHEVERALRASLASQARRAPAAGALADRVIAETQRVAFAPARDRRWQTWVLPLVAAGTVVGVVGSLLGVSHFRHAASGGAPAGQQTSISRPAGPISSSLRAAESSAQAQASSAASAASSARVGQAAGGPLHHFALVDLTFDAVDDGYALGVADCLSGPGRCTAMMHTHDGGRTWQDTPSPPANVPDPSRATGCNEPCVIGLRFATDQIGYAYGSSAVFMTTDGGRSWSTQPGSTFALETLNGNVIRVVGSTGCPPGCTFRVELAAIGSSSWRTVELPAGFGGSVGAELVRSGHLAYLATFANLAGGAPAKGTLYVSRDDGASWTSHPDPCPDVGREIDSTRLAAGVDGSVTILCTPHDGQGWQFTTTSTDGGASFRPGYEKGLGAAPISALGAVSSSVLFVSSDGLYRSLDGGRTWHRQDGNGSSGPGEVSWIGFESATVGRAVSTDGTTIWTTRDAGGSWSARTFG